MGDRGPSGNAWGARDEASWWPGAGELQHQEQNAEQVARSTAPNTHQLYSYKMSGGFSNNAGDGSSNNYDYRVMSESGNREESSQQHGWWYGSGSVDSHEQNSPTQNSSDSDQGNQSNGVHQQQEQSQQQQSQQLQQHIQQRNQQIQQSQQHSLQQGQQVLQQLLQQQQQESHQHLQQSLSQAQALALQQQVAQTLQQHQQTLQEHIQAVQQQQIQAALQRQSATLQELQQQAQQQALLAQGKGRMPRARADNKPRGRMTAYAFFVQTCREEHKKKHPDENVVFAEFSKKCAERWNNMSEKEKQRFHAMADQDKRRYDLEMQSYVPPKGVKLGRGKKRKQIKDPNAPKRSLSAFFWFCNDERSKVKAINPEYTMGDIAKELGKRWASADQESKSKYEALSEQDKARYDREMTAYKKGPLGSAPQSHAEVMEADFEVEDYE